MSDNEKQITMPRPAGGRLRVGRKVERNLYMQHGPEPSDADVDVGRVDTVELAAALVDAYNREVDDLERLAWLEADLVHLARMTILLPIGHATDADYGRLREIAERVADDA